MSQAHAWPGDASSVRSGSEPDFEAIEACRRGDIEGLAVLYERYRLPVYRTCLRILGDRSAADDAAQEVFLRVYDRLSAYQGLSAFSTWLYRLAVNHCLNLLDRTRRRPLIPVDAIADRLASGSEPDEVCAQRELQDRIARLLGELSHEHRAVLVLREIEDLSYREIAEILEVPLGTVMSRLSRARDALKQLWLSDGDPFEVRERGEGRS